MGSGPRAGRFVDSGPRDSRPADAALPSITCGSISIRSLAVTRSRHVTIIGASGKDSSTLVASDA
jgi:hypothetical protein